MKFSKKAISLALTLFIVFSLFAFPASSDSFGSGTAVTYQLQGETGWVPVQKEDSIEVWDADIFEYVVYKLLDTTHSEAYKVQRTSLNDKGTVANIKFTVTGTGLLSFEYAVDYVYSSSTTGIYTKTNEAVTSENYSNKDKVNSDTTQLWTPASIQITEDMLKPDGTCDIYFAFVYNKYSSSNANIAALSNVSFSGGSRDFDKCVRYDSDKGSVSVSDLVDDQYTKRQGVTETLEMGETVYLTAEANANYEFCGWILYEKNGSGAMVQSFAGASDNKAFTVDNDSYLVPIFAEKGYYVARVGAELITKNDDLAKRINALNGEILVIFGNAELKSDATIPSGSTVYVTYQKDWTSNDQAGKYRKQNDLKADVLSEPGSDCVGKLTIDNGTTLTVNGKLVTGGEIGTGAMGYYQSGTTGAFGLIENNGAIVINNKASLVCYGYITGEGTLTAKNGSTVKEPFIISDYTGGSNSSDLYYGGQFPFKRYALQNIRCEFTMNRGGTLTGMADLFASGGHNEADIVVIGNDSSTSLFVPNGSVQNEEIMFTRTIDTSKKANSTARSSAQIYQSDWEFYGGIDFCCSTLNVIGISLKLNGISFPIPYNISFNFNAGTYNIPASVDVLPGTVLSVASDATVNLDGKLLVFDGLTQSGMSGTIYPTSAELKSSGYSASGTLIVNGTLNIADGSTLGGVVQTTGSTGKLVIGENCNLRNSASSLSGLDSKKLLTGQSGYSESNFAIQNGGIGSYDDNTAWFNLPARIYDGTGLVKLESGKTYSACGAKNFTLESYSMMYATNGTQKDKKTAEQYLPLRTMTFETVTINQSMTGKWVEGEGMLQLLPENVSIAKGSLNANVEVTAELESADNGCLMTLRILDNGSAPAMRHVAVVSYSVDGTSKTVAQQNAGGAYIIPDGAVELYVRCAMVGDLNEDGEIESKDASALLRISVDIDRPNELQQLMLDINNDGNVDSKDSSSILRYSVGLDASL